MSSDWFNLFVHQGKEFFDSVSRKGKAEGDGNLTAAGPVVASTSEGTTSKFEVMENDLFAKETVSGLSRENTPTDTAKKQITGPEKDVYESQLEQLQEQLVDVMIQNQELVAELKCLRNGDVSKLTKELEKEQLKRQQAEEKLKKMKSETTPGLRRRKRKEETSPSFDHMVDLSYENKDSNEKTSGSSTSEVESPQGQQGGRINRIKALTHSWYKFLLEWATLTVWDIVSDLTEEETIADSGDSEGPQLTVKTLKDNIRRFKSGLKPISEFFKKVNWVLCWQNPAATMLIFLVYLFSIWYSHFLSLMLFLAIVQLSANYFYSRFGSSSSNDEVESPAEHASASWSDRFQVVLHVARQVQNFFGLLSDYLEKIKNLLTWKVPYVTFRLYLALWGLLLLSVTLSGPNFFKIIGIFLGFKLFIQDPIYKRFPKLRKRYDTTLKLWNELPVDGEINGGRQSSELEESQACAVNSSGISSSLSDLSMLHSKQFCERYKLTTDEVLARGWEEGYRTSLMNKQRPLSNIKHGRLYLTQNYLCFERSRSNIEKNILLKLSDIRMVNKYKPLFIIPGTGMSIEVCMKDRDEVPYIFGAIVGRDDAYNDIVQAGKAAGLPWATGAK